ncbi:MAG: hypothetical protein AAGA32_00050 [Pseudomonadota bacterium]
MSEVIRAAVLAAMLLAGGCAEPLRPGAEPGQDLIERRDFAGALGFYRQGLAADPDNPTLREGFYSAVEATERHYLDRSRRLARSNDIERARGEVGQALVILPESTILRDELDRLGELGQARKLFRDARVAARLGREDRAADLVEAALSKDPEYVPAIRLLQTLAATRRAEDTLTPIRLTTGAPVTMSFQNAAFKDAALALGRAYGVNIIFDADLADREVSVYADGVEFVQAFELLLRSNRAFYRRFGANSVIIAPDTPGKRAEYEDYVVRTFFIESGDALTMGERLATTLGLANVTVDEAENTVTVRASAERVLLADQLISVQDRRPAEVVMEVEVLEINRTKSEQLGLDFGSQISVIPPSTLTLNDVFPVDEAGSALGASALSLPAVTLRFFKQDVDARTLASPSIRALSNKEASFLVGEEVPLRSAETIDPTGQSRTTFDRRNVGIQLTVTPEVRLNASVAVDLALEVSAIGQNLGTADEPAFSITTRNVTTRMLLDDGETAIIGGLIQDEDRDNVVSVPGLGRIPAVGGLFRNRDGEGSRTDIILTLTPRVVRTRDLPSVAEAEFYSGTGVRVAATNPNDFLARPGTEGAPTIRLDLSGSVPPAAGRVPLPEATPSQALPATEAEPVLSFGRAAYQMEEGGTTTVILTAAGFPSEAQGELIVRYRPDIVALEAIESPQSLPFQIDATRGQAVIELTPQVAGLAVREIARLTFRGESVGLSYLIFGNAVGATGARNLPPNTTLRNARIVVRER